MRIRKRRWKFCDELELTEDDLDSYTNEISEDDDIIETVGNKAKKNKLSIKRLISVFAIIITVVSIFACLLVPEKIEITVQELSCRQGDYMKRCKTVVEDGWTVPDGVKIIDMKKVFTGYSKVIDYYRKTETIEEPVYREVPEYRTRYYYETDKWFYEMEIEGQVVEIYWDEKDFESDKEISSKKKYYYVLGINDIDEKISIRLNYDDWSSLKIGQKVTMKVSIFGKGNIVKE